MDERQREKELRRLATYMRSQGLITDNYEHGMQLTTKAKKRLIEADLYNIKVPRPPKWDKKWRLVFYDIPEKQKSARDALARKLHHLGFFQMQRSIWVHPYPCREAIETVCSSYNIDKYVTYVETSYIANQSALKKHFPGI
jgi:DNA-binding transcriptional regulator PaaX